MACSHSDEVENVYITVRQIYSGYYHILFDLNISTKFYQNQRSFIEDVTKMFGVFYRFTVHFSALMNQISRDMGDCSGHVAVSNVVP